MSRNGLVLLAARLFSAATTLLVLAAVGRTRGAEALGAVALGFALGALLTAVNDAGASTFLIREMARDPRSTRPLLATTLAIRLVTVPLSIGLAALAIGHAFPGQVADILAVAAGLVAYQFADLTRMLFIGRERMLFAGVHSIVENAAWVLAILVPLALGAPIWSAFGLGIAVSLVSGAIGYVLAARFLAMRPARPSRIDASRYLRGVAPFAALAVLAVAGTRADALLVAALVPADALAAVGAYFAALRLVAAAEYIPESLARSVYPALSRAATSAAGTMLTPPTRFLITVGLPAPAFLLIAGPWLMGAIFGASVAPYAWIISLLGVAVPIRFLGILFGMTLMTGGGQRERVVAVAVGFAVTVLLDVLLVPRVGIVGAPVAAVAAAAVTLLMYVLSISSRIGALDVRAAVVRASISTAVAAVPALLLRPVSPELAAAGFAATYGALVFLPVATLRRRRTEVAPPGPGPR